jgi:hypothetical protein
MVTSGLAQEHCLGENQVRTRSSALSGRTAKPCACRTSALASSRAHARGRQSNTGNTVSEKRLGGRVLGDWWPQELHYRKSLLWGFQSPSLWPGWEDQGGQTVSWMWVRGVSCAGLVWTGLMSSTPHSEGLRGPSFMEHEMDHPSPTGSGHSLCSCLRDSKRLYLGQDPNLQGEG